MDLILWRHAEAHDVKPGQDDLERALTPKGERQARRIGEWLDGVLPASTRVLVSPALRTQQTARALPRKTRTLVELAPGAQVIEVLDAAGWPSSERPVLVIGHQPTLGLVASTLLSGGIAQPWSIRKGGVWWLRRRERDGVAEVLLECVKAPGQP